MRRAWLRGFPDGDRVQVVVPATAIPLEEAPRLADEACVTVQYLDRRFVGVDTYRDPRGVLLPGDLVEVPTPFGTTLAKVTSRGRGSYTGPVKDVVALFERATL